MDDIHAFVEVPVAKVVGDRVSLERDQLAAEEPLEIRLAHGPADDRRVRTISITMRTPGHDAELAAGFLLGEGIIRRAADISAIGHVAVAAVPRSPGEPMSSGEPADFASFREPSNVVLVELATSVQVEIERLERHFYTTSSCGVCGKTSIEAIQFARARRLPSRRR